VIWVAFLHAPGRHFLLFSVPSRSDHYTNTPEVVSSDFVGSRHAGVLDSLATIVQGNRCVLYIWYDNEYGQSCRVVRMVQKMAGVELPAVPN
jgi:glyceraldehyde 3-phosphate dehydrogenase